MGDLFNEVLIRPIITVLVAIYKVLFLLGVPYALGFSIIILTILIRLLLYPLTSSQLRSSKRMQALSPKLSVIRDRHKGDTRRIQEETTRLFKEHNVNPVAGCLPVLVQLPIIWALYAVSQKIVALKANAIVSEINKIVYGATFLKLQTPWDPLFFGVPLSQNPSQLVWAMPLVLLVPIATAVLQFVQSKMMVPSPNAPNASQKGKEGDFAAAFQTQSLYIFPLMIGFFSYTFPLGLSLYWNTFSIFGILQQYLLNRKREHA